MCVPAKNGSASFRTSVMPELKSIRGGLGAEFVRLSTDRGIGLFTVEHAKSLGLPMYLSVRHPVERFASLWRDLQRSGVTVLKAIAGISPEGLMDVIERFPHGNDHWMPQANYWTDGVIPVRYDRFLERMGLPFIWRHKSERTGAKGMPVERINAAYPEDVELWEACS